MNGLGFNVAFEIYLLAGSAFLFLSPKDRQLARIKALRPEWNENLVSQFFTVFRLIMVGATILCTYHLIELLRNGSQ